MDYLEVTRSRPSIRIELDGQKVEVRRANFIDHFRLSSLALRFFEAIKKRRPSAAGPLLVEYLQTATQQPHGLVNQASLHEAVVASVALMAYNSFREEDRLRFMTVQDPLTKGSKPIYDYENRGIVLWIHSIATAYHWPIDTIHNLTPEEAACYVQEIWLKEQADREFHYGVAGAGWKSAGQGQQPVWRPLPRPAWMVSIDIPKVRMRRDMLPVGDIRDRSGIGIIAGDR